MKNGKQRAITGFGVVLLLLLGFVLFMYSNFHTVIVSGISMFPTFKNGQRVLVSSAYWLVGPVKVKDVVVLQDTVPGQFIIKRVYKMGGEFVDEVNAPRSWSIMNGPFKVPDGMVYVLGDNRAQSEDSRAFGPVEISKILGKVVVRR